MRSASPTFKSELRAALAQMTNPKNPMQSNQQPEHVKKLCAEVGHSIELTEYIDLDIRTCHAFSFDLTSHLVLHKNAILPDGRRIAPSDQFVRHMVDKHLRESDDPVEGCVVVYFDGEVLTHSGRCYSARVRSKWGQGHIWDHDLFEVPACYGCTARFYSRFHHPSITRGGSTSPAGRER